MGTKIMDAPKSLNNLFNKKIFRIPDYQRGYAWQKSHLKDFWEDLINLPDGRSHYTGVLTLKEVNPKETNDTDNEYWLAKNHSYKMYHIVDGQQRLTTFIVFIQAFIDFIKQLDENIGKLDQDIHITENLSLKDIISRYLYKTKPTGGYYRTYKFGYTVDNPSYNYLRYEIFNEDGSPSIKKTFYTLNLKKAKEYFYKQLEKTHSESGFSEINKIYKNLTEKFLFNEHVIKDEFDVFVAFETINNRGKRLSDLELLKNRLIYLTTLYPDQKLDSADHQSLRESINDAWKEVYYQLGRNEEHPLNDDEFLKAHWIMYFQYSREKGNAYIRFLLDDHFSPRKIHKKKAHEVGSDLFEEHFIRFDVDDGNVEESNQDDAENDFINFINDNTKAGVTGKPYMQALRKLEKRIGEPVFNSYSLGQLSILKKRLLKNGDLHKFNKDTSASTPGAAIGMLIKFNNGKIKKPNTKTVASLQPSEIKNYVNSLKESAVHWFNSYYPDLATELSSAEKNAIEQLNRIGMGYFRPLLMSVFKNELNSEKRVDFLNNVERFIFIAFRLNQARSNYRDSEFYGASREFNRGKLTLEGIKEKMKAAMLTSFNDDGTFNSKDFYDCLHKRFINNGSEDGYYGWSGLRYFLYEYEIHLLSQRRQPKMQWNTLLKTSKDKVSIEHIFPQTPTGNWIKTFANIDEADYYRYSGSLGNLLLLSMSVNSSLQNDDFNEKKKSKYNDADVLIRNSYSDGSASEKEVADEVDWTPIEIKKRGLRLLNFMEERWDIEFKDEEDKEALLFLDKKNEG